MLPPPAPRSPAHQTRESIWSLWRGHPTLLLWLVLLVGFVSLCQTRELGGWKSLDLGVWLPTVASMVAGAFAIVLAQRQGALARLNARGIGLLQEGELSEAAAIFDRLARARFALPNVRRVGAYNLALTLLRQGDPRAAAMRLAGWQAWRPRSLAALGASLSSFCCALMGELDEADRQAGAARAAVAAEPAATARLHLATEAVVALRRGNAPRARELFAQRWTEIEAGCPAPIPRGLRVAYAFAAEREGGESAALVPDLLAGARPFRPGDYAWLGRHWPEMERYLEAKGFGRTE